MFDFLPTLRGMGVGRIMSLLQKVLVIAFAGDRPQGLELGLGDDKDASIGYDNPTRRWNSLNTRRYA